MSAADTRVYTRGMATAVPLFAVELRHNDEVVGCVFAGAVDAVDVRDDDEVSGAQVRFWIGLQGLMRSAWRAQLRRGVELVG